jgi:hypothetical protein
MNQCINEPKPSTQIHHQISKLNDAISELKEAVKVLNTRLTLVIRQEPKSQECKPSRVSESLVPLADTIRESADSVSEVTSNIMTVLNLLEL